VFFFGTTKWSIGSEESQREREGSGATAESVILVRAAVQPGADRTCCDHECTNAAENIACFSESERQEISAVEINDSRSRDLGLSNT
jgi:hypothetical protein